MDGERERLPPNARLTVLLSEARQDLVRELETFAGKFAGLELLEKGHGSLEDDSLRNERRLHLAVSRFRFESRRGTEVAPLFSY